MVEQLNYDAFRKYNPDSYSVKSKIVIHFRRSRFSKNAKDVFEKSLQIESITEQEEHDLILKSFKAQILGHKYKMGLFGYDDNRSVIILEFVEDGTLIVNLFNDDRYIMKDHLEVLKQLRNSLKLTKYLSKIIPVYPCSFEEHVYISNVELEKPSLNQSFKRLFLKYSLLYVSTVGLVNIENMWDQGLKVLVGSGSGIILIVFLFAMYFEVLIKVSKGNFILEI
jgi:hypothetical protein